MTSADFLWQALLRASKNNISTRP